MSTPAWLVTNNTKEPLTLATIANRSIATSVVPADGKAKRVTFLPPLMGFPNKKGFTFLKSFDVVTIYKTWRGRLPSGKAYVALSSAVTTTTPPQITTVFSIDKDAAAAVADNAATSRNVFIGLTTVLAVCLVAAIVVAIVVIPPLSREEIRAKLHSDLDARRNSRRKASCGGGGGGGGGRAPRGASASAAASAAAAAASDVDLKAQVAQMVQSFQRKAEDGTITLPPEFESAAQDMEAGMTIEALTKLCSRSGMDPRLVPVMAAAMQRAQDGSATLEEATTMAVEECLAIKLMARR